MDPAGIDSLRAKLDRIFPVIDDRQRTWLCVALARIVSAVPWLAVHLGPGAAQLADSLDALRRASAARTDGSGTGGAVRRIGGSFGAADAMIGTGLDLQPRGLLTLRGLLWAVAIYLIDKQRPYKSLVAEVASALRSLAADPAGQAMAALETLLGDLDRVSSLPDAIEILDRLAPDSHKTLYDAWRRRLRPTLQALAGEKPPPRDPAVPGESDIVRTEEGVELYSVPRRTRTADQLPSEPGGEESAHDLIAFVRGQGATGLTQRQARYRARQAIWSGNHLLLTTHGDALFPDVYRGSVRLLVADLEALDSTQPLAARGMLGCLLKALTGRTTAGVRAIRPRAPPDEHIDGLYLDVDAGIFCFPPFWKERQPDAPTRSRTKKTDALGYFRPGDAARPWLYPAFDCVALPLPRPVRSVLERHGYALDALARMDDADLDREMADAAAAVSHRLGIPVSVAGLRRSLGPLVMEQCGDLAMAQLVCGDSFGQPDVLQHYYAPRRADIAAVYARVLAPVFDDAAVPRVPRGAARVGSELLVRPDAAKRLARASASWAMPRTDQSDGVARVTAWHRALLDHSVRMLLATTGHRWSEAIFRITLHDLDLRRGVALFRDKVYDVAHDPRLVALPKVVCDQLAAYTSQVQSLAIVLPGLAADIAEVLHGGAPLLFDLQEVDGGVKKVSGVLRTVAERGPPEWRVLPENWGRTYIRTRAIEMGCPAFLASCQLGHYEAVGYPVSNQSPTIPLELVDGLRPWLDRVARSQCWSVLGPTPKQGRAGRATAACQSLLQQPLRDWTREVAAADHRARLAYQKWEKSLSADPERTRRRAEAAVLSHPTLVAVGIAAAFTDPKNTEIVGHLAEVDFYRIRQELVVGAGEDTKVAVERVRALRRIVAVVAKSAGQPVPAIAIPIPIRRPLDNPFFAGCCCALSQIDLLREHVRGLAGEKKPSRGLLSLAARTALALVLFDGVADPALVMRLLQARGRAQPSAKLPDLLLVRLEEAQPRAVRGVAALALANLARRYPSEPVPHQVDIDTELTKLLPGWAVGNEPHGLLARLCSTVAVSNRFEYSPAARFAEDPDHGSVDASVEEQLAFIDGDPVGPKRPAEPAVQSGAHEGSNLAASTNRGSSPAKQYRTLVRMIPTVGKAWKSPLTGDVVDASAVRADSTRQRVWRELDEWMQRSDRAQEDGLCSIMRMLAGWQRAELARILPSGAYLAYKSAKTYLSRIGAALVRELGQLDAVRWDERVVENAYQFALDASRESKFKVARSLLSFHRYAESNFDLPEVDLACVYAELPQRERCVDAAMILPVERAAAFADLARAAWGDREADLGPTRIARAADAIAPLLGYGGARLSEPLGMQLGDIGVTPSGRLWVRVRSNRLRGTKTRAATRVLVLGPVCDEAHCARTLQWAANMRALAGPRRPGGTYLISALDARNDLREQTAVAHRLREALALATGRERERAHRLRHLVTTERIAAAALVKSDATALGIPLGAILDRILQPRDFHAIAVALGHAHWMTTIEWYLQLAWLLRSRTAAALREAWFDRRVAAVLLGVTPFSLDHLLRGEGHGDRVSAWFDWVRSPRQPPAARIRSSQSPPVAGPAWAWTASAVGRLVDFAWRTQDLLPALRLMGAPVSDAARIQEHAERWEMKLGLRLIPREIGGITRKCPARAVRRLGGDRGFEKLWELFDRGSLDERAIIATVVSECFTYLTPRAGHALVLRRATADAFAGLAAAYSLFHGDLEVAELPGGLVGLSPKRQRTAGDASRYRGRGIKRVLVVIGVALGLQDDPG